MKSFLHYEYLKCKLCNEIFTSLNLLFVGGINFDIVRGVIQKMLILKRLSNYKHTWVISLIKIYFRRGHNVGQPFVKFSKKCSIVKSLFEIGGQECNKPLLDTLRFRKRQNKD